MVRVLVRQADNKSVSHCSCDLLPTNKQPRLCSGSVPA